MPRESRGRPIGIKRVQLIPVSGLVASEMGTESKSGQMVPAMREIGRTIELKVRESSHTLMEISTRETG